MNKNKKIILTVVIIIVVILIVIGGIFCFVKINNKNEKVFNGDESAISNLYTQLENKDKYSFDITLDDKNKVYYAKSGDRAYIESLKQGNKSKSIIKDGNSYLLLDSRKIYYTYQNNESDINKILIDLEEIKDSSYEEGKETIENKKYKYEEYDGVTNFFLESIEENVESDEEENIKTRFYFNNGKLVYIKTIIDDDEELLKVSMSDDVEDNLFEIPADYKEE